MSRSGHVSGHVSGRHQNPGQDVHFTPDRAALQSILNHQGLTRKQPLLPPCQPNFGVTPIKDPPSGFNGTEKLEFFEGSNGQAFIRRKLSAHKEKSGIEGSEKRGYARPQKGEIMLPKRMNLSNKKEKSVTAVAAPQTPLAANDEVKHPVRSVPRTQASSVHPLHRQSISENKTASRRSQGSSRLPVPSNHAKKGLDFQPPLAPSNKSIQHHQSRKTTAVLPPAKEVFIPPCKETFVPPNKDIFLLPRESLASNDARESLAWISNLPRQSMTFNEIQKLMNDNDKKFVNDDATESFEALEKRMKTPMKKKSSNEESFFPPDKDTFLPPRESLAWISDLPRQSITFNEIQKLMNDNERRFVNDDATESFEALEKRMKTPKKKKTFELDQNKENNMNETNCISTNTKPIVAWPDNVIEAAEDENKENIPTKSIETKEQKNEEAISESSECLLNASKPQIIVTSESTSMTFVPPTCYPVQRSLSENCLVRPPKEEEAVLLCRATSQMDLETEGPVLLSNLVPALQVEQVLNELDSEMAELSILREKQDKLAAETEAALKAITRRREQFKQLWGVSPMKINTQRTVLPPAWLQQRKQVARESGSDEVNKSREEDLENSVKEDSLSESYNHSGIEPLAETPFARRVRFDSGLNRTRVRTPSQTSVVPTCAVTPTSPNLTNRSFAALKTSFSFLATPGGGSTPHVKSSNTCLGVEPTPLALRKLGDRVRDEWARLNADTSEEDSSPGVEINTRLMF